MSSTATEFQKSPPSLPLPPDHVLNSGAVTFPGSFDQQGCPLVVFPVEEHNKLSSSLNQEEVVDFINYFLRLHNKYQEKEGMVSVVVDLRQATLTTTRFIAETLLLLEMHKRTVHTLYVVQPKKKDVLKLLLKLLVPNHSKHYISASFKRVFLKEIFELSNYIDRSQLTATLGGYLIYCHQSWVMFIKEIDAFVQDFLSVVHRLPSCIATLQTLSRQNVPDGFEELKDFCSINEARFQQLRRELGLDDLLRHCEHMVEKLRYPENESSYQAMAGTALFTHTAYDMLQTTAVELLWQQAFSRAHLQLKVLQLANEAQQITEHIISTQKEKLQPYRIEIAKDARRAESLKAEFENIYTPAMALVRRAEDVIHTFEETVAAEDGQVREEWVEDLERVKENFRTAVELPHQTLRVVADFYYYYNKSKSWYNMVLCEDFFQDLLWGGTCDGLSKQRHLQDVKASGIPVWKQAVRDFLKKSPSPEMEELVQLAHLANVIPESQLQQMGKQLSHRCMILRKLLTSPGAVPLNDLQLALQWQYEFLRGNQQDAMHTDPLGPRVPENVQNCTEGTSGLPRDNRRCSGYMSDIHSRQNHGTFLSLSKWDSGKETLPSAVQRAVPTSGKPPSLSSFDSGFDGAGSSHLDAGAGREGWEGFARPQGTRETFRPIVRQPQIHEENISSVSDSEDCREEFEFSAVGGEGSSRASIQIIPKMTVDSLNFEIKVKRSATLPRNPWLSLPVEDLENSYTVTITPNPQAPPRDSVRSPDPSERSRDQPTQTETQPSIQTSSGGEDELSLQGAGGMEVGESEGVSILQAQDSFEDSALSPIRNILSSTITDARDKQNSTVDSVPTLLWDTYDFHNTKQDAGERLITSLTEGSLTDWDLKEQEGLREVEEILDRAAGILQAKENVLAQEEMLDVLMKVESASKPWESWGSEEHLSMVTMSSSDLVEAGIVGLEDNLPPINIDQDTEYTPTETVISTHDCSNFVTANDPSVGTESGLFARGSGRCSVLRELKGLHVLEERIIEENFKIHEFRRCEEEERVSDGQSDQSSAKYLSRERQMFLRELEKEKREVEKIESSLDPEWAKGSKIKNRLSRGHKVVKCSIMERTSKLKNLEDTALCDELVSGSKSRAPDKMHLIPTQNCAVVESSTNEALGLSNQDYTGKPELSPDVKLSQKDPESFLSNCELEDSHSTCHVLCDVDTCGSSGNSALALPSGPSYTSKEAKKSPLNDLTEPVDYPKEVENCHPGEEEPEQVACRTANNSKSEAEDGGVQNNIPEVSLIPAMCSNQEAFDPGGDATKAPVPKPRKTLQLSKAGKDEVVSPEDLVNWPLASLPNQDNLDITLLLKAEGPITPPKPKERKNKLSNKLQTPGAIPDIKGHCNNNNNKALVAGQPLCIAPEGATPSEGSSRMSTTKPVSLNEPQMQMDNDTATNYDEDALCTSPPFRERESILRVSSEEAMLGSDGQSNRPDVFGTVNVPECPSQNSGAAVRPVCRSPVNESHLHINMKEMTDFKTPIILDTGSGLVKAGFADQDLPTTIFPTVIGMPKYEEIMNGNFERESYIGHEAQHMRGVLALKYPMKNGVIHNWDEMEQIWHHTFQQLRVDPEDHPVLLTEAAMNPRENRQRMVELMFEAFSVPYTYVAMQAVLALYAAGRTTGVVFDSGDGVSHSVPVFEGYCLPHAVQRLTLAGIDVTLHLQKLLQEQGISMRTSAELEIVREMKEMCCCVAQDYEAELACGGAASSEVYYTMPDGQVICLSTERFRAAEILFKPELIGRDHYGMHESIFKSILHSDIDLRKSFVGNIVLSGGNTLLAGLPQRLESEIRKMVPTDLGECVRVTSPKDRDFSVWSGGAVLASLPSFASAWISEEEYEEFGPQIVFRKCF
ncbi:hypothetical protein AAFF_G00436110 [Aldrovandia affinis]|uniref:CRAL-TRIO domain-containing protein n=1 Tax=Aldrovandia affinis TaxID=143900 RepID=A0AAD7S8E8_9TELE|nr:hypothetical protein AAFF_G00436110 [Aldrovandia affinis]